MNCSHIAGVAAASKQLAGLGFDPVHYMHMVTQDLKDLGGTYPGASFGDLPVAAAERGGDKNPSFTPATVEKSGSSVALA